MGVHPEVDGKANASLLLLERSMNFAKTAIEIFKMLHFNFNLSFQFIVDKVIFQIELGLSLGLLLLYFLYNL